MQAEISQHSEELSGLKAMMKDLAEHVQAEIPQHSEEPSRLKAMMKDLAKKQDLILECLKPKPPADNMQSVTGDDVSKPTTTATASTGDEKSSTVEGE